MFNSADDTTVDLSISGTDGATLVADGTISDDTAPAFDCTFHYSGPYVYNEE